MRLTMNPLLQQAGQASRHLYDASTRELVDSSLAWLEQMPALAASHGDQLAAGITLADCTGLADDDLDLRYRVAFALCEQGEFLLAQPLALHCHSARAQHADDAFLAASCLQRLGIIDYATMLFRHVLQIDEYHMAAAYRLGECLLALGDREAAAHLFSWAVELGRHDASQRELQNLAMNRLAGLG
jgi:tetratricopeptide (TPR) repeat protein